MNYIGLPEFEGQQQMLRVNFGGIYGNVRRMLITRIGRLGTRYCKTRDPVVRAEIDRLNAEFAKPPTQWTFVSRAFMRPLVSSRPPIGPAKDLFDELSAAWIIGR